jgi:hypothetical protein
MGLVVTRDGVRPDERNAEAVTNFPVPTCTREQKSFLGLAG